ncbi:MAG: TonB-dependent receptor, partial [Allomuricauda sp.]
MKPFCSKRQPKKHLRRCAKTLFSTLSLSGLALSASAQQNPTDSLEGKKIVLDEVLVQAVRVTKEFPITFSNLDQEEIAPRNLGQDIPILMNYLP